MENSVYNSSRVHRTWKATRASRNKYALGRDILWTRTCQRFGFRDNSGLRTSLNIKHHINCGPQDPGSDPRFKTCHTKCPSGSDAGENTFQFVERLTASLSAACLSPCDLPAQFQPTCDRQNALGQITNFFVLFLTPPGRCSCGTHCMFC